MQLCEYFKDLLLFLKQMLIFHAGYLKLLLDLEQESLSCFREFEACNLFMCASRMILDSGYSGELVKLLLCYIKRWSELRALAPGAGEAFAKLIIWCHAYILFTCLHNQALSKPLVYWSFCARGRLELLWITCVTTPFLTYMKLWSHLPFWKKKSESSVCIFLFKHPNVGMFLSFQITMNS